MQDTTKNLIRTLAIFAGNYLARNRSALEREQIVKVLAQSFTSGMVEEMFQKYVPDYSFINTYQESFLMFAAIAATDLVYEKVLQAYNGTAMSFNKTDFKEAIMQGAIVGLGNAAGLY